MDLTVFYEQVARDGSLMTPKIAARWTDAILRTLALNLSGKVKKELKAKLPDELAQSVGASFNLYNSLLGIRNTNISAYEFQNAIARRAGNSDFQFAKIPTIAVFGAIKQFLSSELNDTIADDLSPELNQLWQTAEKFAVH